jgi:hypothetical protein
MLKSTIEMWGRRCRLKRYIAPGAKPAVIELVLEALMHNTRVEVLYIQVSGRRSPTGSLLQHTERHSRPTRALRIRPRRQRQLHWRRPGERRWARGGRGVEGRRNSSCESLLRSL